MTFLRTLFLATLLLLPLAAFGQDAETTAPTATIATGDNAQLDADIAVRMREILGELGNYEDVTVQVNEGIVTLRGTTTTTAEAADLTVLASRIEGVVSVRNQVTETADIVRRLNPAVERFRTRIDQMLIMLPLAAIAAAVFAIVAFLGFRIARARNPWDRLAPNAFIADLYRQIVRIAFLIAAIVIALDILNATALLSTILGAAGLIGLAIGFAVRDAVENFIASVLLSVRQPFRPNDVVEINGDTGKVIRLTSRATILLSFDGNHIRIPNATVYKSRIMNFSTNAERRFMLTLGVDSHCDLAEARTIAAETVQALPFILDQPAVSVWLGDITDSGVEVIVTGWVDQAETSLVRARGEALRLVKAALENAGISLPNTTYTIDMVGSASPDMPEAAITAPTPQETVLPAGVEDVAANSEAALNKLVEAERDQADKEDLLHRDAAEE